MMEDVRAAYTTQEAAALLACHPETLRRAIRSGELKATGRSPYRISIVELKRWWEEQGGGELEFPAFDDDMVMRIKNPVDRESAVLLAQRIAQGMRSLTALKSSLEIEELPELYDEADALERAADQIDVGG